MVACRIAFLKADGSMNDPSELSTSWQEKKKGEMLSVTVACVGSDEGTARTRVKSGTFPNYNGSVSEPTG
jgi:hypothetical protein